MELYITDEILERWAEDFQNGYLKPRVAYSHVYTFGEFVEFKKRQILAKK